MIWTLINSILDALPPLVETSGAENVEPVPQCDRKGCIMWAEHEVHDAAIGPLYFCREHCSVCNPGLSIPLQPDVWTSDSVTKSDG